jgi:DNA mismatch repair ATPase MutS
MSAFGHWQPLAAVAALEGLVASALRRRVQHVVRTVERPGRDLRTLAELLARVERERFTASRLVALREMLDTEGLPPSRQIARLRRLIELADARRNQLFAPIGWLLLWTTQLALSIESWRAACGPDVADWLTAAGELEALCALAGYASEHPDHPFPTIVEGAPQLDGRGLGPPLLLASRCVPNDVRLGHDAPHVLVVSGSNMSGKSTLLRTVGLSGVLAQAGAPVPADTLTLTPLAVGASIRLQDSLQSGTSRFYAEVTRVKQLVDLASDAPALLFLLDELFHGTNSHDRRIGSGAVVHGLLDRGAIGLVTTHDLAIAAVANGLATRAANVHFEDQLRDGRVTFDYRVRPGVVTKSNALELMRAVGLEV